MIDTDTPCIHCRYNLRGLRPMGNCPECGACIEESLQVSSLKSCETVLLQQACWGLVAQVTWPVFLLILTMSRDKLEPKLLLFPALFPGDAKAVWMYLLDGPRPSFTWLSNVCWGSSCQCAALWLLPSHICGEQTPSAMRRVSRILKLMPLAAVASYFVSQFPYSSREFDLQGLALPMAYLFELTGTIALLLYCSQVALLAENGPAHTMAQYTIAPHCIVGVFFLFGFAGYRFGLLEVAWMAAASFRIFASVLSLLVMIRTILILRAAIKYRAFFK